MFGRFHLERIYKPLPHLLVSTYLGFFSSVPIESYKYLTKYSLKSLHRSRLKIEGELWSRVSTSSLEKVTSDVFG